MEFKQPRFGTALLKAAADPGFFQQIHVIFGGTGAVGGSTAMHLISAFEEAAAWTRASLGNPHIVVTGRSRQEVRQFTSRLFALQERDHGARPEQITAEGYRTVGGVIVELKTLSLEPFIPELSNFSSLDEDRRKTAVARFLASRGIDIKASDKDRIAALSEAIGDRVGRPFTEFLTQYLERRPRETGSRFRSVIMAIPIASLAAYKLNDLEATASSLGFQPSSPQVEELKSNYLEAVRNDLAHVPGKLADEVLVAHTTAVGGMYDEEEDGQRVIRLGFGHSALDDMRDKQIFAERLTRSYSEVGIKMLITAAAIGVDSISVRKAPPLHPAIRRKLQVAEKSGLKVIPQADAKAGVVKIYEPVDVEVFGEPNEPLTFAHRAPLVVDYVLKSGENGYFTVSNADALYRVMRVASDSELGLLLARTALFGDTPHAPRFQQNVCYYTETDYSRQIFELLSQPELRAAQMSGLQPKALQDLGSAKHQGELHTLGLLILLHRLKTLNLDAIPPNVDLKFFNPQEHFERHSQRLTLDHVMAWEPQSLADDLRILITGRNDGDLAPLKHFFQASPTRQEAAHRVLQSVLRAVWTIPSLGSPFLYEDGGERRAVVGYYAAPVDHILTHKDSLGSCLRRKFNDMGGGDEESFERFVEFHVASNGFVDVRPVAVLVTARNLRDGLKGKVEVFRDEATFVEALGRLEPYSYFSTSGVLALLVRLKALWQLSNQLKLELGSANEFRANLQHEDGRALLVPGVVESFRMISEGLEKNTGLERLDGPWGYRPL